jgi:hypothetical protein
MARPLVGYLSTGTEYDFRCHSVNKTLQGRNKLTLSCQLEGLFAVIGVRNFASLQNPQQNTILTNVILQGTSNYVKKTAVLHEQILI